MTPREAFHIAARWYARQAHAATDAKTRKEVGSPRRTPSMSDDEERAVLIVMHHSLTLLAAAFDVKHPPENEEG